jgi:hypothetical protein
MRRRRTVRFGLECCSESKNLADHVVPIAIIGPAANDYFLSKHGALVVLA